MSTEQFSSFQIGKMLNVSRQAVNQWIDKGYIISYRTPGGHRRVRRVDLVSFLRERSIPMPDLLQKSLADQINEMQPRIMLVDDDEDFLVLMQQAILDQIPRAQITLYSNGYDALAALGAVPPDLLVLDLKMPNVDGVEICRRLKTNIRTRALPILIVSAHDGEDYRQTLGQLGVSEVCSKSMSVIEVAGRIADLMRLGVGSLSK